MARCGLLVQLALGTAVLIGGVACGSDGAAGPTATATESPPASATGTVTASPTPPPATSTATPGMPSATPTASPTPEAPSGWRVFESSDFGVRLAFPADWEAIPNEIDRFAGESGFVSLNAMGEVQEGALAAGAPTPSMPLTIDAAAAQEAGHVLMPYGSSPEIVPLKVAGYGARLILPSADQPAGMNRQAELVVQPLQPESALGHPYRFLLVYANEDLIREIASTIGFLPERHAELGVAAAAVRLDLAARLGALLEGVEVLRWDAVTWSDGCLGLGGPAESCDQALVDGFSIWMVIDDGSDVLRGQDSYLYRTDLRGQAVRLERGPVPAGEALTAPIPDGATPRE